MKHLVAFTFALLLTFVGPYSVPAAGEEKSNGLAGSVWSGKDSDGDFYEFSFEQDGTLAYKSPSGSFRNGKWSVFNNAVYLQMNNHVSEYLGEIEGDVIVGKAWNRDGRVWLWKVAKQK